jgi:hypothetical protein
MTKQKQLCFSYIKRLVDSVFIHEIYNMVLQQLPGGALGAVGGGGAGWESLL